MPMYSERSVQNQTHHKMHMLVQTGRQDHTRWTLKMSQLQTVICAEVTL